MSPSTVVTASRVGVAEDALELWSNGAKNVITFPDEPRSMTATRNVSHHRRLAKNGK